MLCNEGVLSRGLEKHALFVILLAQRSASREFTKYFMRVFGEEHVYHYFTVKAYVRWKALTPTDVNGYRVYSGYSNYRNVPLDRPLVPLTVVRHPFFRVVSIYNMSQGHERHFLHDLASSASFEEFYIRGSEAYPTYFHNTACLRVAGTGDFPTVKRAVQEEFGAAVLMDQLSDGVARLSRFYGWSAPGLPPATPEELTHGSYTKSEVYRTVMDNNEGDLALYELVKAGAA